MVYSPVDFAAYSRATGQPYPETPEERAAMVDDVRRFREQQLKRDEGPGLLESAAMGAGILGGLIGAGLAGKKLLAGRRKDSRTQSGRPPGKSGVEQVDLSVAGKDIAAARDYVPPSKKPSTLVDVQETNEPQVRFQSNDAVDSSSDQMDSFVERSVQRDTDSVRLGKDNLVNDFVVFSRKADDITKEAKAQQFLSAVTSPQSQPISRRQKLIDQFGYAKTDLDSPAAKLRKAAYEFEQMDLSGGMPESDLEAVGQAMAKARYNPTGSAYDLSGDPMDLPGVSGMSVKERKRIFNAVRPAQGSFSDVNLIAQREKEFLNRPREGGFGESSAQDALDDFIQARRDREAMLANVRTEIADRTSAAASLGDSAYEQDLKKLLLDPTVSTDFVKNLLGSTVAERRGRVGTNLTQEVTEGARASMVDKDPELGARMVQLDEDVILVDDRDPFVGIDLGQDYETYGAEGLAAAEGPGTMVDTESYRERTNKGTTQIPGDVMETGKGDSTRMERFVDKQVPVRTTEEGDPSRGYSFTGGRYRLEGEGSRTAGRISSSDINIEGSRLPGNVEDPVTSLSDLISTQPGARYREGKEKLVRGSDGKMYIVKGRIIDPELEKPLMATRATKTTDGKETRNVFLKSTPLSPVSLRRDELEAYAQDASYDYFNNPTAKKNYLEKYNPDLLAEGVASGKTLDEIGDPSTYNNFIINSVQNSLREQKGLDLEVLRLKQNTQGIEYYPKEAHAFVTALLKTTKATPLYGVPAAIDEAGNVSMKAVKRGNTLRMEPAPAKTKKGVLFEEGVVPGQFEVRGSGGVDPMQVGDDYEGKIGYYTPRIQTAPQVVKDARTGELLTATTSATGPKLQVVTGLTGQKRQPVMETLPTRQTTREISLGTTGPELAGLRQRMETAPQGLRSRYVSNVGGGLIANTRNPYTGYGYAAYGSIYNPLPEGTVATSRLNLPTVSPQQQLNRGEVGEAAQRARGTGAVLRAPDMTESEYIERYGLGQRAMNRAATILANRPVGYTAPRIGLPTEFTYYPPKI